LRKIGLLSDTHGHFDEKVKTFFKDVDELWHAGDIGNIETADKIAAFKPFKAVYGNIDDHRVRAVYPEFQDFYCEDIRVLMTHIGGYPERYYPSVRKKLQKENYQLFISGHSHILKVMQDKKHHLLHINPGASGNNGLHQVKTATRFFIKGDRISDLEILELPRR